MCPRRLGGFGDQPGGVIGRGAQHGKLAGEYFAQGVALSDVRGDFRNGGARLEAVQLVLRAVHDRHGIVAGPAQQFRNHGSDLARADDNDVFHIKLPMMSAIVGRRPYEW